MRTQPIRQSSTGVGERLTNCLHKHNRQRLTTPAFTKRRISMNWRFGRQLISDGDCLKQVIPQNGLQNSAVGQELQINNLAGSTMIVLVREFS